MAKMMRQRSNPRSSERPKPKPIDAARLDELALGYVARFATSAAKLDGYLRRKLRERGWAGDGEPPLAALVERMVRAGYINDAVYARSKSTGLLRRGYGQRRVDQALGAAGIAEGLRHELRARPADQRAAALALARKRRFGPFGAELPDRIKGEKQIAAMLRAGHPLDSARELVNAVSVEAAEAWAAGDDGEC